jgi:predicted nucleic acid-binding protein
VGPTCCHTSLAPVGERERSASLPLRLQSLAELSLLCLLKHLDRGCKILDTKAVDEYGNPVRWTLAGGRTAARDVGQVSVDARRSAVSIGSPNAGSAVSGGAETDLVAELILAEVLQGFREDRGFEEARRLLGRLEQIDISGKEVAIEAARNYRKLRGFGVTVRGTVDLRIATRCVASGLRLLHADGDFNAFERYLGLRSVDLTW